MSFREKSAWISLIAYGCVFGAYFFRLSQNWEDSQGGGTGQLVAAAITFVIAAVALSAIVASFSPKEADAPADERETLIDLKAERIASYVLSAGVLFLMWALLRGWNSYLVANLLLASLVIASLVKAIAQIAYFRAGS